MSVGIFPAFNIPETPTVKLQNLDLQVPKLLMLVNKPFNPLSVNKQGVCLHQQLKIAGVALSVSIQRRRQSLTLSAFSINANISLIKLSSYVALCSLNAHWSRWHDNKHQTEACPGKKGDQVLPETFTKSEMSLAVSLYYIVLKTLTRV